MRISNSLRIIGIFSAFVLASCAFIALDGRFTMPEPTAGQDGDLKIKKHKFYDISVSPPAAELHPEVVVATSHAPQPEEMRLLALFQAYHTGLASAVVHVAGLGAYRYRAGDEIQPGVRLGAILPDRVLLQTPAGPQALHLQPLRRRVDDSEPQQDQEPPALADDAEPEEQMDSEAMKFLARLDLYAVSETLPEGYLVGSDFPPEATEQTGIKPGDIIVSVNGYPVGEASSDYLVWLSFRSTHKAAVLVRNEEGEFFVYYPEGLVQAVRSAQ
nr:type II secretion system protein N [Alcanivorax quisquiliarum]